jgi:hypothetical protein
MLFLGGGHGGSPKSKGGGRGGGAWLRGGGREGGAPWGAARCGLLMRKNSQGRKEREEREKENIEGEKKKRKEKMKKLPNMEIFGKKNER